MPTVADVLRRYGGAYLERFGPRMPAEHRKVLHAIMACRTAKLGTVFYRCSSCGRTHAMGRSCGNRHCPSCQQGKTKAWLEKQLDRLLPCPYFLLTFTLPAKLRTFVRAHQRVGYAALFEASSGAIKRLAADPKYVGTRSPGFLGVLHTWGRTLEYHPHVHYVVPGGGLSDDGTCWLPSRADFFVPVRALSKIFRAKFRDCLQGAGLLDEVDADVWRQDWVVHSKAVGDGRASLKYLAPYVFRVAISDHRIVSCDDANVTFSCRKSGSRRWRRMTLSATEFMRRFLQHVLPTGFQKVRHYGFASPNSKQPIESVRWVVTLHYGLLFLLLARQAPTTPPPRIRCAACGGAMIVVRFVPAGPRLGPRGPPPGRSAA
jgi:hypothetical protein